MKILVTGAAGFIGSHVADAFIDAGHDVVIVDNFATGQRRNVHPQARFYEIDVRSPDLERVFESERPDVIDHHAAHAEVLESVADPVYDAEVNVLGTVRLLDLAVRHGVRKFIFISTGGAIYGDPETLPCDESHPQRPLSPYGASKLACEQYLNTYALTHGLEYTVLRYGNVYGPRQDTDAEEGRVISIFTQLMLAGRQPTINGSGEQERDFVYVGDCVRANVLALDAGAGEIVNIGTGRGASVNEVAELLSGLTDYQGEIRHGPTKAGEVFKIYLDASKAKRVLGWAPQTALEDGLAKTVEYFRAIARERR